MSDVKGEDAKYCCVCGWEGAGIEEFSTSPRPGVRDNSGGKESYCRICRHFSSGIHVYPHMNDEYRIARMLAMCTNLVLEAIESRKATQ